MRILAIDTSGPVASAAVWEDGVVRAEMVLNVGLTHSQTIMPAVDAVLRACDWTCADMDVFAAVAGPGSFTGVRIGVCAVKGMAHALAKPCVQVHALEALAMQARGFAGAICPILDARRDQVYSAAFRFEQGDLPQRILPDAAQSIGEFMDSLPAEGALLFLGDGVNKYAGTIEARFGQANWRACARQPLARLPRVAGKRGWRQARLCPFIFARRRRSAKERSVKAVQVEIRPMRREDLDAILEIEHLSFTIPWSRASFEQEVSENRCARYLVVVVDGRPVGYAGMWLVLDEGHITNVAIHPDYRGRKLGEKLMRALIQLAADTSLSWMTLEVRRSNAVAQSLYRKLGFIDVGYRKRYYADNKEDALIMALETLPEGNPDNDPFLICEE